MRPPSEETVDGAVTGYGDVYQVKPPAGVTVIGQQPAVAPPTVPPGVDPLAYYAQAFTSDARSRSVTLFIEVPLLAYVALHPEISGLIRLLAAGVGVYRVAQVMAPTQPELQLSAPEPG